jgi:hypothetical protein
VFERRLRIGKVFQHKTDKDMIEAFRPEREPENIPLPEGDIGNPFVAEPLFRPLYRVPGDIE